MKGYWRNEKATAATFSNDGWLKTGDIAYRDDAGKWYMVDRKKVSIKNQMSGATQTFNAI